MRQTNKIRDIYENKICKHINSLTYKVLLSASTKYLNLSVTVQRL